MNLLDPTCVYDEQGQVIYASQSFLELLQANAEEIGFFNYFSSEPTSPNALINCWTRALQGEKIEFFSRIRATCEDIECSLQFNPKAKLMFLVVKKIDQGLRIQKLTEAYEQLALALFNHPNLAIALVSPDGIVVRSNQKLHELLGTDKYGSIYIEQFVHPDDRMLDVELKQQLLDGSIASYSIEKRFITNHHEIIWLSASVSLIELPTYINGYNKYVVALLEDVTENKELYHALVRTEEKWKTFVLNSPNLFIQMSSTGQIIYVSPAVESILGYTEEELLDAPISILIHPHDFNEFNRMFHVWINGIQPHHPGIEARWRTRSGEWVYLYIQGQRFPLALEIDGVVISGYNITARKLLELKLSASEERFRSLVLNVPGAVFRCGTKRSTFR